VLCERLDTTNGIRVDGHADDFDALCLQIAVQVLDEWERHMTWPAPGRPELYYLDIGVARMKCVRHPIDRLTGKVDGWRSSG
jgi:hypothetical protein